MDTSDRCDRCGAQAYVHVELAKGDLLFCGHHYAKHKDSLPNYVIVREDTREILVGNKSTHFVG